MHYLLKVRFCQKTLMFLSYLQTDKHFTPLPFKVNIQVLTWISHVKQLAVSIRMASDEGENRKRIVMPSFWKKNKLY